MKKFADLVWHSDSPGKSVPLCLLGRLAKRDKNEIENDCSRRTTLIK
jgi:hypothetical protein